MEDWDAFSITHDCVAALLTVLGALTSGTAARANIVFDFTGECSLGCIGTATGMLTLTGGYVFGSDITSATFVSFSYASDNLSFAIPAGASLLEFEGGLNADGSVNSTVAIDTAMEGFRVDPEGFEAVGTNAAGEIVDEGSEAQFHLVAIPEPATWAMFMIGFAGLGMAGMGRGLCRV
jgi:hypothetical protein